MTGEPTPTATNGRLSPNSDFDTDLRLAIQAQLGNSGFADRDRYDVFGWETQPDEDEYVALYLRNAYARAVVDRPATTTWRRAPAVDDEADSGGASPFEDAVDRLVAEHDLTSYCERVDRLAGIGEYALLFVDFDDASDLDDLREPYQPSDADLDSIRGLRVYAQAQVDDVQYGEFGTDRWGQPERYTVDLGEDFDDDVDETRGGSMTVHHSRVVAVPSTQLLDDEHGARPRLEPVLNQLYDIEKTLGAVAEAAYRGADYGLALKQDPTKVDTGAQSQEALRDELERYEQDLQRYIRLSGTDVERLGGDVQDPSGIIDAELSAIAAQTGIPKRVLSGDAAGELSASEEDTRRWYARIRERQEQYATPHVWRAVLDLFRDHGIIPEPADGNYDVEWPELFEPTEEEIAGRQQTRSQTVANLGQVAPGLARQLAENYVESGDFPDDVDGAAVEMAPMDEGDAAVANQFRAQFGLGGEAGAETANADADDLDLTPPEQAQENARKVVRWREEYPDEIEGMTEVGWRRARQLANGGELSADVVTKMAQFNRHRENGDVDPEHEGTPWRDAGRVAWLGWGGDAGVDWAIRQSEKLTDNEDGSDDSPASNASRYAEGDTVMTPQGIGVVAEVRTEAFEGKNGDEIAASDDSPVYAVGLKDERVGVGFYRASQLEADEIEVDVEAPVDDVRAEATANDGLLDRLGLTANDWTMPPSWRKSETPARLILLKAWAGMNGQFDCGGSCCKGEMMASGMSDRASDEFCAAMKDEVLGGWEGWRGG